MAAVHPLHPVDQAGASLVDGMRALVEQAARDAARGVAADPTPKGLYSVREAAEWLAVSESLVREWVDVGALPVVRPPDGRRLVRIRREDLEAFRARWSG